MQISQNNLTFYICNVVTIMADKMAALTQLGVFTALPPAAPGTVPGAVPSATAAHRERGKPRRSRSPSPSPDSDNSSSSRWHRRCAGTAGQAPPVWSLPRSLESDFSFNGLHGGGGR